MRRYTATLVRDEVRDEVRLRGRGEGVYAVSGVCRFLRTLVGAAAVMAAMVEAMVCVVWEWSTTHVLVATDIIRSLEQLISRIVHNCQLGD